MKGGDMGEFSMSRKVDFIIKYHEKTVKKIEQNGIVNRRRPGTCEKAKCEAK